MRMPIKAISIVIPNDPKNPIAKPKSCPKPTRKTAKRADGMLNEKSQTNFFILGKRFSPVSTIHMAAINAKAKKITPL